MGGLKATNGENKSRYDKGVTLGVSIQLGWDHYDKNGEPARFYRVHLIGITDSGKSSQEMLVFSHN